MPELSNSINLNESVSAIGATSKSRATGPCSTDFVTPASHKSDFIDNFIIPENKLRAAYFPFGISTFDATK